MVLGFDVGTLGEELVDEAETAVKRRKMERGLAILRRGGDGGKGWRW
jgi:hypothetical protein